MVEECDYNNLMRKSQNDQQRDKLQPNESE